MADAMMIVKQDGPREIAAFFTTASEGDVGSLRLSSKPTDPEDATPPFRVVCTAAEGLALARWILAQAEGAT